MEESGPECKANIDASPIIQSLYDDESMEPTEEALLLVDSDSMLRDKSKKKKKKCKGGLQSPKRILAFNTSELLKLDEHKAEMKKNTAGKNLSKSASFPSNCSFPANCGGQSSEASGDSEDLEKQSIYGSKEKCPVLTRCNSVPRKSALRGGYEELGFGPRPKLHVKWAPSVWEPPCSLVSHTANRTHSKKDSKHGHKVRSSRTDSHKQQRKKSQKVKHKMGSSTTKLHEAGLGQKLDGDVESPAYGTEALLNASLSEHVDSETSDRVKGDDNPEAESCFKMAGGEFAEARNGVVESFFSIDSKCAASFLGINNMPCKFIYGQQAV